MKRLMTMLGVAGLAVASFAAVDDTLISFSTPGPDKYADGTDVLPGEVYALVWSADGQFDGIKADGTTVDPADKVVLLAGVAKQGANGNDGCGQRGIDHGGEDDGDRRRGGRDARRGRGAGHHGHQAERHEDHDLHVGPLACG